jgi:phosphoribosylformimino-5-aminoimidazole carboxamide ribotide isomerase
VRSVATAAAYLDAGVARVVVGSLAIDDPDAFSGLSSAYPGRIVLGLDARDGIVAVRGWRETGGTAALEVARRHAALPLAAIVFTDIARDGMLEGPNLAALGAMLAASSVPVVASGGIASAADIRRVAAAGAAGCIVGKALYTGAVSLAEALAAAGDVA